MPIVLLLLGDFSKTSSCGRLLLTPSEMYVRGLSTPATTPWDKVVARLRRGLDLVGSMRENDFELWDISGRPKAASSGFDEDMVATVLMILLSLASLSVLRSIKNLTVSRVR